MDKDRIVVTTKQTNDMLEGTNGKIIGNPKMFTRGAVDKSKHDIPNPLNGKASGTTEPENKAKI